MRVHFLILLAACTQEGGVLQDGGSLDSGPTDVETVDIGLPDLGLSDFGWPDIGGDPCALAVDGQPCTAEGTTCGGPCPDACSFCNLVSCIQGEWRRVEVFPLPCFDCGDSRRCIGFEEYCAVQRSDVVGESDVYSCEGLPKNCLNDPTCMCLANEVAYDQCTDDEPGALMIEFFGG